MRLLANPKQAQVWEQEEVGHSPLLDGHSIHCPLMMGCNNIISIIQMRESWYGVVGIYDMALLDGKMK